MSVRLNLPPIALMIEIEVVHPAGHPQQHFTHHRDVGEMVGVDRYLRVDTIRQRITSALGSSSMVASTPSLPGVTVSDCNAPCA